MQRPTKEFVLPDIQAFWGGLLRTAGGRAKFEYIKESAINKQTGKQIKTNNKNKNNKLFRGRVT